MLSRNGLVLLMVFFLSLLPDMNGFAQERVRRRWLNDKPRISAIRIDGNAHFSDSDIRKRMYSQIYTAWNALKGERRATVRRETLRRDTLEIKYLYLINGFLGVRVAEEFQTVLPDSTALVQVRIDEGRQYVYGKTSLTGSYGSLDAWELNKLATRLKPGKPVNPFDIRQVTFDMKSELANSGYPYAVVTDSVDTTGSAGLADLFFNIESDSLVRFGDVLVEGTDRFPEYAARRELKIRTGNIYRRNDILDSQRRLLESGYFVTAQPIQSDQSANRLSPDFVIKVRERKSRFITATTGASQSPIRDLEWDLSAAFGKRNFLGSRRYELRSEYAFSLGSNSRLITHLYRVRFTEPWLLGVRMPLILSGEVRPRIKSERQDYDVSSWSVTASTLKRFGREIRLNLGAEYQSVDISGIPIDQIQLKKEEDGVSVRRRIFTTFRRDSRDDLFVARRGSVSDISLAYYGGFLGGDENFYKLEASWSVYQVVWPGWTLAARLKGGLVREFGQSESVPRDDRLYRGGANSVRGFKERTLGPVRDDGLADGANITAIGNLEFRWKTLQVLQAIPLLSNLFSSIPLYQSVFFDAGNGFRHEGEMKINALAFTYGTGIQLISPAGPIRIDYARRIKTASIDFADRWHFTILYAF
ncbi:MAG: outer membrane protein assembly factor [Candidatus Zixiibacteriota bacterium]